MEKPRQTLIIRQDNYFNSNSEAVIEANLLKDIESCKESDRREDYSSSGSASSNTVDIFIGQAEVESSLKEESEKVENDWIDYNISNKRSIVTANDISVNES